MMRRARKNEVSQQERAEIVASFYEGNEGDEWDLDYRIRWHSVTRFQQKCGCHSRWALETKSADDPEWEDSGQLEICTECGNIVPVIPGNVFDEEYCTECYA
jgi:hypothetical protein